MTQITIELYPISTDIDTFLGALFEHLGSHWPNVNQGRETLLRSIPTEHGRLPVTMQRWPDVGQEERILVDGKLPWLHVHWGERFSPHRQVSDLRVTRVARERLKVNLCCYMAGDTQIAAYVNALADELHRLYPDAKKSCQSDISQHLEEQYFSGVLPYCGPELHQLSWAHIQATQEEFMTWVNAWGKERQQDYLAQDYRRVIVEGAQRLRLEHQVDVGASSHHLLVIDVDPILDSLWLRGHIPVADFQQSAHEGSAAHIVREYFDTMWSAIVAEDSFKRKFDAAVVDSSVRSFSKLSGPEFKLIHSALSSAYSDYDELRMMVRFELGENLDAIVGKEKLNTVILKLIDWAQDMGNIERLLDAALTYRPENESLRAAKAAICR